MDNNVKAMLNCSLDSSLNFIPDNITKADWVAPKESLTCWGYWRDYYYPSVIRESYPVYVSERAKDKGKQAFEIIKVLKDKKLVTLSKVSDFIDLMDELIKIL